jgi:hypothetical protein
LLILAAFVIRATTYRTAESKQFDPPPIAQQIQDVQNNPRIPAQAKAIVIGNLRKKQQEQTNAR